MGLKYRLTMWISGALALHAVAACSRSNEEEQRRHLLEADARGQARQQRIDKTRVRDPAGDLLPSETKAAGYVVPRGFTLTRTHPHKWVYDADLPLKKVEEYFDKRLAGGTKSRVEYSQVEWLHSVEKDDPKQVPGWVQIMPCPSTRTWSRIVFSEPNPPPKDAPLMDAQRMREFLAERRRNAR